MDQVLYFHFKPYSLTGDVRFTFPNDAIYSITSGDFWLMIQLEKITAKKEIKHVIYFYFKPFSLTDIVRFTFPNDVTFNITPGDL